jgi:rSAM/selenodomain-associated transferase 1
MPELPLMEDVELVRRLRAHGPLERLPARLETSPRRYESEGPWKAWIRNTLLIASYRLGVPPRLLARWYPTRSVPAPEGTSEATVVVFAKAPRPGTVKTRLAASVGDGAAVRLYEQMGRGVVERLRNGAWRLWVAYAPDDAECEMRSWLGDGLVYRAQRGEDLGRRMEVALSSALEATGRACVVGTDVPDLDAALVEEALGSLDRHDLALGPAEDGGYYLIALRTAHPGLFRDVPWSTARVLDVTLQRAADLGLDVHLLPRRADVDTLEDVPDHLRHLLFAPP